MKPTGRPIRFLVIIVGSWAAARMAMLWPPIDIPAGAAAAEPAEAPLSAVRVAAAARPNGSPVEPPAPTEAVRDALVRAAADPPRDQPVEIARMRRSAATPIKPVHAAPTPSLPLAPRIARAASRWSGSGWLALRQGSGSGPGFGGSQLGGSQAGIRLAHLIDRRARLALAARVATPLSGRGREAAIGIEWQPSALPVRIVAEQRVSLDGGAGGPAAGVIGGIGPFEVAPRTTIEAYGQAGAIARDGVEAFADGAVRMAHRLFDLGAARIHVGAGAWGAAQRDAARLDMGPSLSADLPIGAAHARLSLDWRARVAGDAHPGSGLVLTLGTDF